MEVIAFPENPIRDYFEKRNKEIEGRYKWVDRFDWGLDKYDFNLTEKTEFKQEEYWFINLIEKIFEFFNSLINAR